VDRASARVVARHERIPRAGLVPGENQCAERDERRERTAEPQRPAYPTDVRAVTFGHLAR